MFMYDVMQIPHLESTSRFEHELILNAGLRMKTRTVIPTHITWYG